MSSHQIACSRCHTPLPIDRTRCARCGVTIRCRILVSGPVDAVGPLVTRLAVGYGVGPGAVEASENGVVVSGSAAVVGAIEDAARRAGYHCLSLPAAPDRAVGARRGVALAVAALVAIVAAAAGLALLPSGGEPSSAPADGADAFAVDAAPDALPDVAPDALPDVAEPVIPDIRRLGFRPEVLRAAVSATVHIEAEGRIGSGIVVSQEGHILTNAHVVGLAETASVKLYDERTFEGKIIAHRRREDLAVLELDLPDGMRLRPATFGAATDLTLGQPIFIVGSPKGHDFSINRGFVSKTLRWLARKPCVQLDVPINAGNSGGPLFDAEGRLVGINTYKGAEAEGIGYAQLIEVARQGDEAILQPYLGFSAETPAYMKVLGEARVGRAEVRAPRELIDAARRGLLATTGALDLVGFSFVPPRKISESYRCRSRYWKNLCAVDVIAHVVAVTEKGKRPTLDAAELHLVVRGRTSSDSVRARDRGWRSHKVQDPVASARFDAMGEKLGTELSLWSTTFRFDGFRVVDLIGSRDPLHAVLQYGDFRTSAAVLLERAVSLPTMLGYTPP